MDSNHAPPPETIEETMIHADGSVSIVTPTEGYSDKDPDDCPLPPVTPPDGGWGWVVLGAAFVLMFLFGLNIATFAILYPQLTTHFQATKGQTGWVGSLHLAAGYLFSFLFSGVIRQWGCRPVAWLGVLLIVCGFLFSAWAQHLWVMYITYGLIAGLGSGLLYLTASVAVQQYFSRRRVVAGGLCAAGQSLGQITSSLVVTSLCESYAWRGALVIQAGITLHGLAAAALIRSLTPPCPRGQAPLTPPFPRDQALLTPPYPRDHSPPTRSCGTRLWAATREGLDFSILLREPNLILFCCGMFLFAFCNFAFWQHSVSRALTLGVPLGQAVHLFTIINVGLLAARLLAAGVVGTLAPSRSCEVCAVMTLTAGTVIACSHYLTTFPLLAAQGVAFGITAGLVNTLLTMSLVDMFGVAALPKTTGCTLLAMGLGFLMGTPLAGSLYDMWGDYSMVLLLFGLAQVVGGAILTFVLWRRRNTRKGALK